VPKTLSIDVRVGPAQRHRAAAADVRAGLSARQRSIPPVWFYDETGSRLFDRITRLPEYYLARREKEILARHAAEIIEVSEARALVEIGSGTSEKTRLLLDAMAAAGRLDRIVLLDISEEVLREAASRLGETYDVDVQAVVGDFRHDLDALGGGPAKLWAFLGSTLGNFPPLDRRRLLERFHDAMAPADRFLLGTDLRKDPTRMVAAYNDREGVTAAFNLNVLAVLDAALGADFDPAGFEHVAVWDAEHSWIEMRLRSIRAQRIRIADLRMVVDIEEGEEVLTEISAKFDPGLLAAELIGVGFDGCRRWTDGAGDFQLTLVRPA
jgi:L-histidine N-alpha-methyltransferase